MKRSLVINLKPGDKINVHGYGTMRQATITSLRFQTSSYIQVNYTYTDDNGTPQHDSFTDWARNVVTIERDTI